MTPSTVFLTAAGTIAALAVGWSGASQPLSGASPVPALKDDPQLQREITLIRPRVYLGELLENLSRETGAFLSASDTRFPMSGIEVSCTTHDQPAHAVMDAISAVFSDGSGEWSWRGREVSGRRSYYLMASRTAADAASENGHRIRQQWEADGWTHFHMARLSDADRLRKAASRPDLFARFTRPESWNKCLALAAFTEAEFAAALRGEHMAVSAARLPAAARSRLGLEGAAGATRLIRTLRMPEQGGFMPSLSIDSGGGSYRSLLGDAWWHGQWLARNASDWRGPMHPETQAALKRLAEIPPGRARSLGLSSGNRIEWLEAASRVERASIVADVFDPTRPLERGGGYRRGDSADDSVVGVTRPECCWKRSGDIWLVRRLSRWVDSREYLVSWPTIKALRLSADRRGGRLDLPDLVVMARLRPIQWLALREEFPDADPRRMAVWSPVFRFWHESGRRGRARLASQAGLPLADAGLAARRILTPPAEPPRWPGARAAAALGRRCSLRLRPNAAGWHWEVLDGERVVAEAKFHPSEREPLRVSTRSSPRHPPGEHTDKDHD
jgi:hypothetical protein